MNSQFVVTLTGPEKSGLLKKLAAETHRLGGQWLESKVIHLENCVACIVKIDVPGENETPTRNLFSELAGYQSAFYPVAELQSDQQKVVTVNFDTRDRPGLMSDITHTLSDQGVRLVHIESQRMSVAELGQNMFKARMKLRVPKEIDEQVVAKELEKLCSKAFVEIEKEKRR